MELGIASNILKRSRNFANQGNLIYDSWSNFARWLSQTARSFEL